MSWADRRRAELEAQRVAHERQLDAVRRRLRWRSWTPADLARSLELPGGTVGLGSWLRELVERGEAHEIDGTWHAGPAPTEAEEAAPEEMTMATIRERVLQSLDQQHWYTADEVTKRTGLGRKQVGAALSAAKTEGLVVGGTDGDGRMRYALRAAAAPVEAAPEIEVPAVRRDPRSGRAEAQELQRQLDAERERADQAEAEATAAKEHALREQAGRHELEESLRAIDRALCDAGVEMGRPPRTYADRIRVLGAMAAEASSEQDGVASLRHRIAELEARVELLEGERDQATADREAIRTRYLALREGLEELLPLDPAQASDEEIIADVREGLEESELYRRALNHTGVWLLNVLGPDAGGVQPEDGWRGELLVGGVEEMVKASCRRMSDMRGRIAELEAQYESEGARNSARHLKAVVQDRHAAYDLLEEAGYKGQVLVTERVEELLGDLREARARILELERQVEGERTDGGEHLAMMRDEIDRLHLGQAYLLERLMDAESWRHRVCARLGMRAGVSAHKLFAVVDEVVGHAAQLGQDLADDEAMLGVELAALLLELGVEVPGDSRPRALLEQLRRHLRQQYAPAAPQGRAA